MHRTVITDIDLGKLSTSQDVAGISYTPIVPIPGRYPHPLVSMADRVDHDATWRGAPGNISVLYGPGSWNPHASDADAFYGERHYWPWNVHGPLVHIPAGDVAGDIEPT